MNHYIWWIPLTIIAYVWYAWVSKQNNVYGGIWFWLMLIPIPMWALVSRTSTRLLFDGILYDLLMITTYIGTLLLLGEGQSFQIHQWIGLGLCLSGLILMKTHIG